MRKHNSLTARQWLAQLIARIRENLAATRSEALEEFVYCLCGGLIILAAALWIVSLYAPRF